MLINWRILIRFISGFKTFLGFINRFPTTAAALQFGFGLMRTFKNRRKTLLNL
jgi:hypothetical protein